MVQAAAYIESSSFKGILRVLIAHSLIVAFSVSPTNAQVTEMRKEQQQHKAHFRSLGLMSPASSVAHMYASADANRAVTALNKVTVTLDDLHASALTTDRDWSKHLANATFYQLHSRLSVTRTEMKLLCLHLSCKQHINASTMMTSRHNTTVADMSFADFYKNEARKERLHDRDKRLVDEILSFFGVGLGIYDLTQISALKTQLFDMDNQVNHIAKAIGLIETEKFAIEENSKQISALREEVQLLRNHTSMAKYDLSAAIIREYVNDFIINIENYVHGLKTIIVYNRIDSRFFSYGQIEHALSSIKSKAKRAGWTTIHQDVSEILRDRVSFLAEEGVVFIFVHVELIQPTLHELYELVEAPFPYKKVLVQPKLPSPLFSINADTTEMTLLTHDELNQCSRHSHLYACRGLTILKTPRSNCIGALFLGSPEEAVHYCNFERLETHTEMLIRVSENTILTYVPPGHTVSAMVTCLASDQWSRAPSTQTLLVGNQEISLPFACTISTDLFIVRIPHKRDITEKFVTRPLIGLEENLVKVDDFDPIPNVLPKHYKRFNFPDVTPMTTPQSSHMSYAFWGTIVIVSTVSILVAIRPLRLVIYECVNRLSKRARQQHINNDGAGDRGEPHGGGPHLHAHGGGLHQHARSAAGERFHESEEAQPSPSEDGTAGSLVGNTSDAVGPKLAVHHGPRHQESGKARSPQGGRAGRRRTSEGGAVPRSRRSASRSPSASRVPSRVPSRGSLPSAGSGISLHELPAQRLLATIPDRVTLPSDVALDQHDLGSGLLRADPRGPVRL